MDPLLGAALAIVVLVGGYILLAAGLWDLLKQLLRFFGLLRPRPEPATEEQVEEGFEEVKGLLDKIKEAVASEGAADIDTAALAAAATERTAELLREAIALQDDHREREAIDVLLGAFRRDLEPDAKAQLHLLIGNSFLKLSELEEAEGHYKQALDASRDVGNRLGEASALEGLGLVYADQGDLDRAEQHHNDALAIFREIGNRLGGANQIGNLGNIDIRRGDLDCAEQHHNDAITIHREIGNRLHEANALGNLGNVYRRQGDASRAEQHHREALAIDREIGYRLGEAQDLGNLGLLAAATGEREQARDLLTEAITVYEEMGAGVERPDIVRANLKDLGCE